MLTISDAGLIIVGSFVIAAFANAWTRAIIAPEGILYRPYAFIKAMFTKSETLTPDSPKVKAIIVERVHWIMKPLGDCGKCNAGFFALFMWPVIMPDYFIFHHVLAIGCSITFRMAMDRYF